MSGIDFMPYSLVGGVILASLLAPAFLGADGWIAPLAVLPFAIVYLLIDRRLKQREREGASGH
jgi:uncharacterized membrane protein YoaK (UPF0700 family)